MATTLKSIIASGSVATGATAVLAHTLNINGVGKVPDTLEVDNGDFEIVSATSTSVTVRNTSGASASTNVLCEHWYSVERTFGASGTLALVPQPFISTASQPDSSTNIFPAGTEEIRYVRSATGNDSNDGLTPGAAWLTLNKGLGFLAGFSTNRNLILDVSDSAFTANEQLNFPALFGGINTDLDFGGVGPDNFFFRTIGQIRASPTLQQSLTVTLVTPDVVTTMPVLTVSETLVVNAHVGQFVIGSGLAEYGVIVSNTANTITLAATGATFTAPVGAYTPSTTFTFGDAGNFFQQATYINMFANFTIQGINFLANGASQTALTVLPSMPWNIQLCQIQGLVVDGGGQLGTMDACYLTRRFGQNGAEMLLRSSFFDTVTFEGHGDGANASGGWQGCFINDCNPVGQGNFESRMGLEMNKCEINDSTSFGVLVRGTNISRIADTRIQNSAADGIHAEAPLRLRLDNVVGTGNVGHGVKLSNGAQLESFGTTPTLTGTVGNVDLGGSGTTAWGAAPATDVGAIAPQFCRLF